MISDKLKRNGSLTWLSLLPSSHWKVKKLNKSEPVLKYKLLTSKAYPPTRETAGSIGYDLRSPRFARIPPRGGTYYLPLGIAFQIPEGHYGRLAPKSGLAIYRSIGVLGWSN